MIVNDEARSAYTYDLLSTYPLIAGVWEFKRISSSRQDCAEMALSWYLERLKSSEAGIRMRRTSFAVGNLKAVLQGYLTAGRCRAGSVRIHHGMYACRVQLPIPRETSTVCSAVLIIKGKIERAAQKLESRTLAA